MCGIVSFGKVIAVQPMLFKLVSMAAVIRPDTLLKQIVVPLKNKFNIQKITFQSGKVIFYWSLDMDNQ
jgi:hypothetical protein